MEKKTSKLNRVVLMGITIIILLVPFSLYYVFYVSSQRAYFVNRSHRSLAGIGSQIVSRIDVLRSVVESAGRRACEADAPELDPKGLDLYFAALNPSGTELQVDTTTAKAKLEEQEPKPVTKPEITADFRQVGSTNRLILSYVYGGEESQQAQFVAGFKQGKFSVESETEKLLHPLVDRFVRHDKLVPSEELFDKVFLADSETGGIIFEHGLDAITVANLDDLLNARAPASSGQKGKAGQAKADADAGEPDAEKNDGAQDSGEKAKAQKPDGPARPGNRLSGLGELDIPELDSKVFLQPIQLSVARNGSKSKQGLKLTLCGLVRSNHLEDKSFSFPYTLLLLVILLVLLTALSGPLIKLRLLGPKDGLRKADAVLMVCCTFFGTALVTLSILDGCTYLMLGNQLGDQLDSLATNIDQKLRSELTSVIDQLDALNTKVAGDLASVCQEYKENILRGDDLTPTAPYPFFNTAIWVAPSGEQKVKYTTRTKHTAFVKVTGRRFFEDAKDEKLWKVTGDEDRALSFCLQPLNSRTSGENVAVVSKLMPEGGYVSAMDTSLLSLYQPVLPAGYGFCVIDNNGLVLFHTDSVKNLEENFFEECNNERQLRAAVRSDQRKGLDIHYLGHDYSALVTPINDMPWTLVVFRDKQILRTINLEIMTLAAIALSAYALLLLIAALFFLFLPNSKARLAQIWPSRERVDCYRQILVVNAALLLAFLILVARSRSEVLVVWLLLFPAIAIAHSALAMKGTLRLKVSGFPGASLIADWRRSYSLALVSILILVSAAPSVALFKLMRDEQLRVFLKHGQMSLARGLENRDEQVRNQYSSLLRPDDGSDEDDLAIERKNAIIKRRIDSTLDLYDSFFFKTSWLRNQSPEEEKGSQESASHRALVWFLTTFSPFYNETCVDIRELARAQSHSPRWVAWQETGLRQVGDTWEKGDNLFLLLRPATQTTQHGEGEESRWLLVSTIPPFMSFPSAWLWVLLIVAGLTIAAMYFAVRFAARRFLLLDLEPPYAEFSIPHAGRVNYLIVSPPFFDQDDRFPSDRFRHVDLSKIGAEEWWQREIEPERPAQNLPVVIDRFEFNRDDAAWNERKLRLVENLLIRGNRSVVIISSVDPIGFPLTAAKKDEAKSANDSRSTSQVDKARGAKESAAPIAAIGPADVERWAAVLGSFVRVNAFEQADPRSCPALFDAVGAGDRPWRYLERIAHRVTSDADREEIVAEVGDQAEAYYKAVWSTCSQEERLTLFRVAADGMVSRFDPDLRGLMQRGLIMRDPSLRLMDESFRRFVLKGSTAEGVSSYRGELQSTWERLKVPLLLVLLGVIAFLFITQKELFDTTTRLLTAVTGGIVVLLKLVGMFHQGRGSTTAAD